MKRYGIVLIFVGSVTWASPIVTPSTATVYLGNTVQLSADSAVTWSMMPGSTGTISAGGLYTAPAGGNIKAKNVIAGCPVVPNDHIYNVDVTSFPVHANSATRMATIGSGNVINFEASFPLNVMTNATPTDTMKFRYTTSSDGRQFPVVATPYRGVENSLYPADYFAQDRHQLGVNTDTCQFTEFYNYYPIGTNVSECPTCNAQSGVQWGPMSYQLAPGDGSTDAAGLYIQPLAIRYDELKAGAINHALRFTLSNGYNYSGFVWPGTNFTNQCSDITTCVPYGSRFRLKSSFSEAGFSPTALTVIRAMKKYGMFMADGGTNFHIQTMSDVLSDTTTFNALMIEIPASALNSGSFEIVDESSVMISSASGQVLVPNIYNVIPDNYAVVIATKNSDGTAAYTYIALQPPTVGTKNTPFPANSGTLSVMEKTPQFQIPYWVNGATTTTVSCTMNSTLGSLTSDCLYTAPTSGTTASSTTWVTITPTGVVGTTAAITFPLTVFPNSGIRVNVGGQAATITSPIIPYDALGNYGPDILGRYWASDPPGNVPAWYGKDDDSYPQASWPGTTNDVGLYYSYRHGGSDAAWAAMVPNGTYTLTLKYGSSDLNKIVHSSVTVDSQGLVLLSTTTPIITGFSTYTPTDHSYRVQVSNNQFYFSIRQIYYGNFPLLSAWSLIPVSLVTAPVSFNGHLKINGAVSIK